MSYVKAGGTAVACPSFIGLTSGGTAITGASGFFGSIYFAPQYFNSGFWNRRGNGTVREGLFSSQYFAAQFFNALMFNRKG